MMGGFMDEVLAGNGASVLSHSFRILRVATEGLFFDFMPAS
jgi:hypothetical protein